MIKQSLILILILAGFLFATNTNANIFPNDAQTRYFSFLANQTNYNLLPVSGTITILYISYSNSSTDPTATINIICGTDTLLYVKNMNSNSDYDRFDTRKCTSNVLLTTTSMGAAVNTSIKIIYVPYDLTKVPTNMVVLASSSYPTEPLLSDIASTSLDILPVYASMTAGDILIIICLFILIMLQLMMFFFRKNKI